MRSTGQRVFPVSYSEDGTVRVIVSGKYNLVSFEREVFGVEIDDLEECDLPGPDEPLGAILTADEVERALAGKETQDERIGAINDAAFEEARRIARARRKNRRKQ
jgi:hypothetical protein